MSSSSTEHEHGAAGPSSDFLSPLTIDGQKTLVQVTTREVIVSEEQDKQPAGGQNTPSTRAPTWERTVNKKCRGRGRNGAQDNDSAKLFIAGMVEGRQYSATIVSIDARVVGLEKARVRVENSSATGTLQMSKHPQLKVYQKVSVRLLRKFPDEPTWFDVELDADVPVS
jgi:hypothetical protein